jgi:hypothetical protein
MNLVSNKSITNIDKSEQASKKEIYIQEIFARWLQKIGENLNIAAMSNYK